jgi:diguanylate cyclase (GGDEF)-like protein/PAS domain S-box-containing protein
MDTNTSPSPSPLENPPAPATESHLAALSHLLANLDEAAARNSSPRARTEEANQNRLVQVRLGLASSLYVALRAKHAPTANHCLRVALGVSSWALARNMPPDQLDELEVAALLHDVGKIGVADSVLTKPGKLTPEEAITMDRQRQHGSEILATCCASPEILDVVKYSPAWFNGARHGFDKHGADLPLGAKMLAIVDAFDAMTTDHVYRRAMARERAMAELFEMAGVQFDPVLVKEFCTLVQADLIKLTPDVARRWLRNLEPELANAPWRLTNHTAPTTLATGEEADLLFHQKLLESMHDGVIFIDTNLQILFWNRGIERLTGISAASVLHRRWLPSLMQMHDERDDEIADENCPVVYAMQSGVQTLRRLSIAGRHQKKLSVDVHLVPVVSRSGIAHGAALLLHDASSQITLEERVQTLHEKATHDPLTKIPNRAEFDRALKQFVEAHLELGIPCSLIICDIDHFKRINDTFGHQAGDEALISFAALLRRFTRTGDLVARYGGEEFVLLCADCDNSTATQRAEEIRSELASIAQPMLEGKCITASFGVTEVQPGDSPDTMLRRSDRALLQAKDTGRNRVVQLGSGILGHERPTAATPWLSWFRSAPPGMLVERKLSTAVPLNIAVEKLRGFLADHHAQIISIDESLINFQIDGQYVPQGKRGSSDRPLSFMVSMRFEQAKVKTNTKFYESQLRTIFHVSVRPRRNRDRRRSDILERANQLVFSLRSYLMATDLSAPPAVAPLQEDSPSLVNWLFGKGKNSSRDR